MLCLLAGCAPGLSGPLPLRLTHQELVRADTLEQLFSLRFQDPEGGEVQAYLREPTPERTAGRELPAIVLVAGRETGRRAAAVVPGPVEGVVLAVEYPAEIPAELGAGALLRRLPSIRRSAVRMPGVIRGAARYLAALPQVDSTSIALVGVSFGVPFAAPAGKDPLFRGVALHHGGAGLARLFRANLPIESSLLRGLVARFAAWYFRPLEPARHVDEISPTPLLLINGLHDTLVPRESALLLMEEARPPVRQIWLSHDHLMPGDTAVMRELADSTIHHFDFLRGMGSGGARR